MSLYIDTTTDPELQNYTPNSAGLPLPEVGSYLGKYQMTNIETGQTKNNEATCIVTFQGVDGQLNGTSFNIYFNTGSSNATAARIAIQNIMDIAEGVTGENFAGQRFNFDEKMCFIPFEANFIVEHQKKKGTNEVVLDNNGNPRKNSKFRGIKYIGNTQAQPTSGEYQQPPAQQAQYQQQPVQNGNNQGQPQGNAPGWANR